ncbi:type II secretion system protein, partial [Enhygromyxa salina]|uniref:type II secretion system protein n=1 Tax=Enhygromyxa salina TaxID=215803 RepID=UPI0011B274B2
MRSSGYDAMEACPQSRGLRSRSQSFEILRNDCIVSNASRTHDERGFTLTEIMIVLAVITIVATIAFVGLRNNQWEGAYLRFTDDLV